MGDARALRRRGRGWMAEFDEVVAKADEVVVPVQVNGKVRARLTVPADSTDDAVRELALADAQVAKYLEGRRCGRSWSPAGRVRSWSASW